MQQTKIWSTRGLAPARALSFWNEAISSAFLKVHTEPRHSSAAFQAQLQSLDRGSLSVNRLNAQSYRVVCNTDDSQHDWVFINLHQRGRCRLRQHGRDQWASPGDISINLGNSPFIFDFEEHVAMTCLRLPLSGAAARTGRLHDAAARPLPDDAGVRLLTSYIHGLLNNIDALYPQQAAVAANCLLDLLALSIDGPDPEQADSDSIHLALYQRALGYMEASLGDPEFNIRKVSEHLKLAPRTLQKIFHRQGTTFTACLLDARLRAAERLIDNGTYPQLAQIAYAVGFSDQPHFNRAFRRRFGMTPGERRFQARARPM